MTHLRQALVLFICTLSLLAQGVAVAAMPCAMTETVHAAEAAHAHHGPASAHGDHSRSHDAGHTAEAPSCCDSGYCSAGGCALLVAVPLAGLTAITSPPQTHGPPAVYPLITPAPSTPFRPPTHAPG